MDHRENKGIPEKNIYFCFIDYAKAFDCVDHNQLWKTLKEMEIPDFLICLLRNLYADQETTVWNIHGTTDWFKIEKGVEQGCIWSLCLFRVYAECILWSARLGESQAGIKIAWRNNNNFIYAEDHSNCSKWRRNKKPFDDSKGGE